jgi:tetratricopeptide (TPR) repeat protein
MTTPRFPVYAAAPALALTLALAATPGPARAQEVVAQPVVQPLPSAEVQRLNRALVALAKAPRDRETLIEAGQAALGVDDLEAAIGFFGRAAEVDPGHPAVAQGLAGVYLRSGRAAEALRQYELALAGGAPEREVLADQALAFDLVGDQAAAQAAYARALALDPGHDEARRRLAVSHAIAGSRARFEETLRPLLDRRDVAAQRARAFGLAILGDQARAAAIVEQVMPRDLALRLVPYLAYMPQLTKGQQAAAANLGIFPRAADIGRDDPRLARFAEEERADSRLAPSGAPLDARDAAAPRPAASTPTRGTGQTRTPAATPAPAPAARTAAAPTTPAPAPAPAPASASASQASSRVVVLGPAQAPAEAAAPPAAAPAATAPAPAPALAQAAPTPVPPPAGQPPVPATPSAPASEAPPLRVADAFADLLAAPLPDARAPAGAVDLSRIAIRREPPPEKPKPKPKEPPKPLHPSRVWVQVATGKDLKALGFDWKRISRAGGAALAPLKPHTVRWGAANRLLAGPLESRDKAEALVRTLKGKGLDCFLYVSPEGEQIQPLE